MGWATVYTGICSGGPCNGMTMKCKKQTYMIMTGHTDSPPEIKGTYRYLDGKWVWDDWYAGEYPGNRSSL